MGAAAPTGPRATTRARWVTAVVAAAIVGIAVFGSFAAAPAPTPHPSETLRPPAPGLATLASLWDEIRTTGGWTVIDPGTDYIKQLLPEESGCEESACALYELQTGEGCQGGFLVEVAVQDGDVVVAHEVVTSRALDPKEHAVVLVQDHTGLGRSFQLIEAHCTDG